MCYYGVAFCRVAAGLAPGEKSEEVVVATQCEEAGPADSQAALIGLTRSRSLLHVLAWSLSPARLIGRAACTSDRGWEVAHRLFIGAGQVVHPRPVAHLAPGVCHVWPAFPPLPTFSPRALPTTSLMSSS